MIKPLKIILCIMSLIILWGCKKEVPPLFEENEVLIKDEQGDIYAGMEENEAIEGTLYQSIVLSTMKELTSISATSFYSEQHEAPVFLFVGNFITSNELNDVKVAIDNANNEFGFANISYVLNTDNTDLEVSNGSIYIPNLFVIPTNPAIYYIWNGNCYYSLSLEECKETAKDSIISFFKEIYVN